MGKEVWEIIVELYYEVPVIFWQIEQPKRPRLSKVWCGNNKGTMRVGFPDSLDETAIHLIPFVGTHLKVWLVEQVKEEHVIRIVLVLVVCLAPESCESFKIRLLRDGVSILSHIDIRIVVLVNANSKTVLQTLIHDMIHLAEECLVDGPRQVSVW